MCEAIVDIVVRKLISPSFPGHKTENRLLVEKRGRELSEMEM